MDTSILLLDDTFSGIDSVRKEIVPPVITLDMDSQDQSKEAKDNQAPKVEMEPLLSCDKCEFDCETSGLLQEHVRDSHTATE